MKIKIYLFLMVFFSVITFAQKTVSGKITDEDGVAIPSASVTIEEPGKDAILAYGITNSKGEYKVSFTSSESNVDLKVKAFNQKPITKQISNSDQTLTFKLQSEATEIKEVQLKTKMITARGDTIAYDLKAFDNKSDRTLADVMKKIPGIEVKTDGTILYQGNAINKFYVEGKDLMEGGYGTITNSLPKDAVAKLEVLENHQPVKMLQGKIPSDAAAINIKLKKAVTMTGRGEVGSGFGDPWLWNLKLTPMFFSKKQQWVVNYKTNSMGEQVENEGNILAFGSSWEGRRGNASQNNWLGVENASVPNLPVKRYLFNNVHYLSANYLTNIDSKKEWELKANANYTNNVVERESNSVTRDFQQGTQYNTRFLNNFYTDKLKGELIFTKNAKKGFFKNTTTFSQFWNGDRAFAERNDRIGYRSGNESVQSPTSSFQNSLSTIIPWKEKMVNLKSYINYQDDKQTLEISPANYLQLPYKNLVKDTITNINFASGSRALQDFRIRTLDTSHSANISFTTKGWTFTPEVGIDFSTDRLNTNFQGTAIPNPEITGDIPLNFNDASYENDLKFTEITPRASISANYKSDAWNVWASFPVNLNNIKAEDAFRNVSKTLNKTTFTPNIFAQYGFASFFKASINGNISNNFGDIQTAYAGYVLTSPSGFNVMNPKNPIPQTNTKSGGARLEYRNPLNNLFFNVGYRISDTKNNLLASSAVNDLGFSVVEYIERENKRETNSLYGEVGKYFPKFKTNASVTFNQSTTISQSLRNNEFLDNKNLSNALGFKFNNTYFSWMSVDFNFTKTWNKQSNGIISNDLGKTENYSHNLNVFFYPLENHTVGFYWDQINSNLGDTKLNNGFFDISYQFSWSAKKVDFELKWMNIADKKVFERINVENVTITQTTMQLRPSQVMLAVKFNFK
ncbi:carboxypeptidase-like regulatory domain-containing protein [Chryseobacterium sp. Ch-15]|uniref:Carboxypeptidase regulatory-like domain-containing protein n=1 Tax=Chryseobacterium muglaense TaxID=2893752 RepID=A0A9Q3UTC4_9FLAO|nr:carboxypeptidase-like regulatory domain-containing protein [Chryseobacterium muglaense]MBD3904390.1 carboxypeptidase regulatory-like domain-containing protein [Chryseobacterium muglaense]MCC9035293.1 carboxypeptidase-like regulatory domain-containing protein [Chryseobacterium muglaense]MCM2554042.1 carboxypeptidase-like regulatory domain-containing protein [Chryseobacterium muglaense]